MITLQQIEEADFLCKQATESAKIALVCWAELDSHHKSLVAIYRAAGFSTDEALLAFEKAAAAQNAASQAASRHMENSNNLYSQLLAEYKDATS